MVKVEFTLNEYIRKRQSDRIDTLIKEIERLEYEIQNRCGRSALRVIKTNTYLN